MSVRFRILTGALLAMLATTAVLVILMVYGMGEQQERGRQMRLEWIRQVVHDSLDGHTMVSLHPHELENHLAPLQNAQLIAGYRYVNHAGVPELVRTRGGHAFHPPAPALVQRTLAENRIVSDGTQLVVPIAIEGVELWGTLQIELDVPTNLTHVDPWLFQLLVTAVLAGHVVLWIVLYVLTLGVVRAPVEVRAAESVPVVAAPTSAAALGS